MDRLAMMPAGCGCHTPGGGGRETGVENGNFAPMSVEFSKEDSKVVKVVVWDRESDENRVIEYREIRKGNWVRTDITRSKLTEADGLSVSVDESLSEPPRLVATREGVSRTVWNPNPQLVGVDLSNINVVRWRDRNGRDWQGGLYKPAGFEA